MILIRLKSKAIPNDKGIEVPLEEALTGLSQDYDKDYILQIYEQVCDGQKSEALESPTEIYEFISL